MLPVDCQLRGTSECDQLSSSKSWSMQTQGWHTFSPGTISSELDLHSLGSRTCIRVEMHCRYSDTF